MFPFIDENSVSTGAAAQKFCSVSVAEEGCSWHLLEFQIKAILSPRIQCGNLDAAQDQVNLQMPQELF